MDIKVVNGISENFEVSAKRWEKRRWDIKRRWFCGWYGEDGLRGCFIDDDRCVKSAEEYVERRAGERGFYWGDAGGILR